jgi:PAS domain S-box-containing protein
MKRVAVDLQKIIERLTNPHHSLKGPHRLRRVRFLSSILVIFILAGISAIVLIISTNSPIFNILTGLAVVFLVGTICVLAIVLALIQYQEFQHTEPQPGEFSKDNPALERDREALEESENRLKLLVAQMPVACIVWNTEFRVVSWNPAAEKIFGFSVEEAVGRNPYQFIVAEKDKAVVDEIWNRLMESYITAHNVNENLTKGGRIIICEWSNTPLHGPNGQVMGVLSMVQDITEQKQSELALKANETRYRDLFSRIPAALYLTSIQGQILDANQALVELLGYPDRGTLLKVNAKDIFTDPKDRVLENALVVIEGVVRGFRLQLRTFDSRRIWVRDTFRSIKDTRGNVLYEGGLEDITEQVQAEGMNNKNASRNQILAKISQSIVEAGLNHQGILDAVTSSLGNWTGGGCFIVNFKVSQRQFQLDSLYYAQPGALEPFREMINIILNKRFAAEDVSISSTASQPISVEIMDEQQILAVVPPGYQTFLNQHQIDNILFIPLRAQNEVIGQLGVVSNQPGYLHEGDQAFLQEVANRTSLAMMNAQLFEGAQRNLSRLEALRQIDIAITATLDLRVSLGTLLDQVIVQSRVDAADVLVLNSHTHTLDYVAGKGFLTKALQNTHLRMGEGYAGRAALEQKILNIADLRQKETDLLRSPYFLEESFSSYIALPLIAMGEVKGVLEVFHRSPLNPDKEWLDFLEALAGQAAIAIDSVGLFKDLQRSNQELITAYDATIEGWSRALDLRDRETEGHTRRVTEMTLRLAREMEVNEVEQVHMRRGAMLHDIGKMGIPDSILLKPGPLTEGEWQVMHKHPIYAYEMLIPINYLRPALDIPYCHHEKWDGTGYPRGLKGNQIPLVARIFAIVDVWDALCSERPYRSALPKEATRKYIQEQAGSFFDPNVTNAFFKLINTDKSF